MKREKAQKHLLKIIAIFFAVSLWFYVLNSEPIQIEKKLTINYIVPKGYAIASLNEREITLKVKGSKAFIQNIFTNKEKFNVDLNPYFTSSGRSFKVKFFSSDIAVPFGVEVIDLSPKDAQIELDRMEMIEMPISIQYIGDGPKDRRVREMLVTPQSIMISGPVEILKTISNLETAPVNRAQMNKDEGVISVTLANIDTRLKFEEAPLVKIKYKTQPLNSRRNAKKDLQEDQE